MGGVLTVLGAAGLATALRGAPGGRWTLRLVRVAGTVLLIGDLWAMTGGTAGSLTLAVGAITAMLWVAVVCADLARTTGSI